MPKATLTFNLPEENAEYRQAVYGGEWKSVVYEVDMLMRNALKHGHQYKTADEALQAVRDHLWNECKEYNLDPWTD